MSSKNKIKIVVAANLIFFGGVFSAWYFWLPCLIAGWYLILNAIENEN